MSAEAKPYALEEVDLFTGHDEGTSRARIRATVEALAAKEAEVTALRAERNALKEEAQADAMFRAPRLLERAEKAEARVKELEAGRNVWANNYANAVDKLVEARTETTRACAERDTSRARADKAEAALGSFRSDVMHALDYSGPAEDIELVGEVDDLRTRAEHGEARVKELESTPAGIAYVAGCNRALNEDSLKADNAALREELRRSLNACDCPGNCQRCRRVESLLSSPNPGAGYVEPEVVSAAASAIKRLLNQVEGATLTDSIPRTTPVEDGYSALALLEGVKP